MLPSLRSAALFACLSTGALASLPHVRTYFESRLDPRLSEVAAIRRHLEEVEHQLRAYPPEGLDGMQAAARARRLEDLRDYRLRGEFPHNPDFPDRRVPYFIDARGTACAVGYLILQSGGGAFAKEIARTRNHAYIDEIDDPRLAEWARRNGLTLEECARIQPTYAPRYYDVLSLGFDAENRPWMVTGSDGFTGARVLSVRDAQGWSTRPFPANAASDLCMQEGGILLMEPFAFNWNGKSIPSATIGPAGSNGCEAAPDGKSFWVKGKPNLRRYKIPEGREYPDLLETVRAEPGGLPSDTVTRLAVSTDRLWVGTPGALAWRVGGGPWSHRPYSDLGGRGIGGLGTSGGPDAWLGLFTSEPEQRKFPWLVPFSENGLHHLEGNGQVTRYHRGNSSLASDTVYLAAPAGPGSVWLSFDQKALYRFTPPSQLIPMPFSLPAKTHLMKTDRLGRLYLGTMGTGLYRVEGDSLVALGHPTGTTSLAPPGPRREAWRLGRAPWGPGAGGFSRLDLLGRRFRASD